MATCGECGIDLGGGQVAGFYSGGQWSTSRQGNYCYRHQESPSERRWNVATSVIAGVLALGMYLSPFIFLFLVLRFA